MLSGDRNLVKLDIDAGQRRPTIYDLTRLLGRAGYRVRWMSERRSPSGKGWHLVLKLRPVPVHPAEVVALQLLLGGDREREACQLLRARQFERMPGWARDRWNVLYRTTHRRRRRLP